MASSSPAPPSTSISSLLYNAATGNLSADQVDALQQQETARLVQAGMDPQSASAQAQQDVNNALATFNGSGAFGQTWTGALPGGPNWTTAAAGSTVSWLASNWIWLALGGVGLLFLSKKL